MKLRNSMKEEANKRGIKLTYMPFIIKATSIALKQYPILNTSLSNDLSHIIYKNYHHIGVAIDSPNGLIVPNVKDVQSKSIFEIAQELNRLVDLASKNKISTDDLSGGTFTISNIGNIGKYFIYYLFKSFFLFIFYFFYFFFFFLFFVNF